KELDEDFYKDVVEHLPTWIKNLAESYGIDFNNFKNLQISKLELAKEYQEKLAKIEDLNRLYKSRTAFDPLGINERAFGESYREGKAKLEKEAEDFKKILDGIDIALDTTLNIEGYKTSSKPKEKKEKKTDQKTDPVKETFELGIDGIMG